MVAARNVISHAISRWKRSTSPALPGPDRHRRGGTITPRESAPSRGHSCDVTLSSVAVLLWLSHTAVAVPHRNRGFPMSVTANDIVQLGLPTSQDEKAPRARVH